MKNPPNVLCLKYAVLVFDDLVQEMSELNVLCSCTLQLFSQVKVGKGRVKENVNQKILSKYKMKLCICFIITA